MKGVSDPRPQDMGSWVGTRVSLDGDSELSCVPCLLGFGSEWEMLCGSGEPSSHSSAVCCVPRTGNST